MITEEQLFDTGVLLVLTEFKAGEIKLQEARDMIRTLTNIYIEDMESKQ